MDDAALSRLKRALSSGLESLPNGISGHRTFSYGESEYLVRPLTADPATITRLTILDRADHHLPEIVMLANGAYEVQRRLPNPTLATIPLRTPEEMHATYERVWNAIGACHEAGIAHGDVHPENILYQGDQITIID